jgi:ribonuclease PH
MNHRTQANNISREISITPQNNPYAEGSVEVNFGNTKVNITASISEEIPKWLKGTNGSIEKGWITAEYGMLPRSTHTRNKREAASGKQSGRTLEIQRLIGRSMRTAVSATEIPGALITIDCDVIVADGGTRTAAISGGWVALCFAINAFALKMGLKNKILINQIAAISSGSVNQNLIVDLCYEEDSNAEFDCNFVLNSRNEVIEIQGTAEKRSLSFNEINSLYELSLPTISKIMEIQRSCVGNLNMIEVK